ncbi:MAG: hypothetical protein AAB784_02190 [Patescibacteria group bacterium]
MFRSITIKMKNKNFKKSLVIMISTLGALGFLIFSTPDRDSTSMFSNARIIIDKNVFMADEAIEVKIDLGQEPNGASLLRRLNVVDDVEAAEDLKIVNSLYRGDAEVVAEIETKPVDKQSYLVTIKPPSRNFKAGKYTIKSAIITDGGTRELSQDFNWGVLAINVNKATYRPNETAKIFFGVLDEAGSNICDAKLVLKIKKPDQSKLVLSTEGGQIKNGKECLGNNITSLPDYFTEYQVGGAGVYNMELAAETRNGVYEIKDYFTVEEKQRFEVERVGPTRINPVAAYDYEIIVKANEEFEGMIAERVPSSYQLEGVSGGWHVSDPNGALTREIIWEVKMKKGESRSLKYKFDAPDVSPEFYLLGPLRVGDNFQEKRYWQIAADPTKLILLWDNGASIPTGWTCESGCAGGTTTFADRIIRASGSYNVTGGTNSHTTTVNTTTVNATTSERGTSTQNTSPATAHTHTASNPTIGAGSNLPSSRTLRVISNNSGIPSGSTALPSGAIGFFSATVPSGWTRYSAQDDFYILASDSVGVASGSNTHQHTITWQATDAAGGGTVQTGNTGNRASTTTHTHTAPSATNSTALNQEPVNARVIMGKINADGPIPKGMIGMFDGAPSADWTTLSGSGGELANDFIRASVSYDATTARGGATHSHGNETSGASGGPSATQNGTSNGTGAASETHTHTETASFVVGDSNIPKYITVIMAQKTLKVSGNAYADEATTAWVPCDGTTANISLVVNGGAASTTNCADLDGAYAFNDVTVAAGNPVSVFFNATDSGVAVTIASNSVNDITLNPRKNRVWVKTEKTTDTITNSNLDHCDSVSPADCANVPYFVTSGVLTVEDGVEIHIESGKTFAPGGNVSVPNLHVVGTYTGVTGGTETLTLRGSGTGACSTDPGTIRPLCIDGGTFTASETTVFTGTATSNIEATTFEDLVASRSGTTFQTMTGTATLNDQLTVKSGTILTLAANNSTMTVANTASVSGTFTSGTGTKTFSGDFILENGGTYTGATSAATTKFRGANANIKASTTWTKNSEAVTFDRGGGLTTTWTDSNSTKQDMGAVTISANGGNTTVNLSSSVKATTVAINASQTLSANGSNTLTLLGNGTSLNVNGTFTPSTGTVEYVPDAATGVTLASISYNNLTLNKTSNTFSADGNMTISGSSTPFVITAGTFDPATFVFTYNSTSATNITAATYYNLTLAPSGAGGPTYTLGTDTGQTITVSNDLTIGGANAVTVTANTNDPTLDVDRDFSIDTGDTFTASNTGIFRTARNWTNSGTFNNSSGTVTLDTTTTATITGATTFQNFNVTTAGKTLQFQAGVAQRFDGTFTVTGESGNRIHIHSDSGGTQWKINLQGTDAVTYAHIEDSGCEAGTTTVELDNTSVNGGGNDTSCWVFPPNATSGRLKGNLKLRGGVKL